MKYYVVTTYASPDLPLVPELQQTIRGFVLDNSVLPYPPVVEDNNKTIIKREAVSKESAERYAEVVNDYFANHPEITEFESSVVVEESE